MFGFLQKVFNPKRLKDERFEFLLKGSSGNEFVALDCETTGLDTKKDEILSIGAVKIKNDKILISESFERFVKPKRKISEESIKIHHIRPCDIENGCDIKEAIEDLMFFIGNSTIIGYYIDFDIKMISKYTKEFIGINLPHERIELSSMYYKRYRKNSPYEFVDLKFDTILNELDLPRLGQHDALNDAIMSAMIYLKLKNIPEYKGAYS
jgi:DNA polymerase-3 subunit epsilon